MRERAGRYAVAWMGLNVINAVMSIASDGGTGLMNQIGTLALMGWYSWACWSLGDQISQGIITAQNPTGVTMGMGMGGGFGHGVTVVTTGVAQGAAVPVQAVAVPAQAVTVQPAPATVRHKARAQTAACSDLV